MSCPHSQSPVASASACVSLLPFRASAVLFTSQRHSFCRIGVTCRCTHSRLFGSPALSGGQAQYVRIPKAGGTLFNLDSLHPSHSNGSEEDLSKVSDSSLLLLADILPTGAFAAIQALQHPKIATILTGKPYPSGPVVPRSVADHQALAQLQSEDRTLTIAVVGLGPVGVVSFSPFRTTQFQSMLNPTMSDN